jgi:ribose transport system permease protein
LKNSSYFLNKLIKQREFALFMVVIGIIIVLSILSPYFFSYFNFLAISEMDSAKGIVIIGITLLLITGVLDLSVGSGLALVGVVTGWFFAHHYSIPIAIISGLLIGAIIGLINSFLVVKLQMHSFIATLGMMYMVRSVALGITSGNPFYDFPKKFINISKGEIWGLPKPFIILIIIFGIMAFFVDKGRFFKKLFYIGSNNRAANLVGIDSKKFTVLMYVFSGIFVAFASIILTSKSRAAIPAAYTGIEMKLIAAAIIGGASLKGGKGSILGSILGLIILLLISNAMTILNISIYWEGVVIGTVLILASIFDELTRKKLKT